MNTMSRDAGGMKRFLNLRVVGAFAAGVIATLGVTAFAASEVVGGIHNVVALTTKPHDPMAHAQLVLAKLYEVVNATDAQKAQIDPLVQQAVAELAPYHDQLGAAHGQLVTLIGADKIDRAAVESLRSQQLQNLDQATRRLLQLVEDVGDVLTPAQRVQLQQHLQAMHQAHHKGAAS